MKADDKLKTAIYIEFGDLPSGQTQSGEICPSCGGGASKEKSFSVTNGNGTLLFHCHRSSCDLRGAITGGGMPSFEAGRRALDGKTSYPRIKTIPLAQATVKFLAAKYRLPEESVEYAGFRWSGEADGRYGRRISMPIYGPDGRERGTSYRSYEGAKPKAIVELRDESCIVGSWYKWRRASEVLVLVEDQISAIKLAPYVHALALLGTNISEELAEEIATANYKQVLICLDEDAILKAVKLQLAWRGKIKHLQVVALGTTDIKDMTDEDFTKFLHSSVLPARESLPPAADPHLQ